MVPGIEIDKRRIEFKKTYIIPVASLVATVLDAVARAGARAFAIASFLMTTER
jgi:hypothetical protein